MQHSQSGPGEQHKTHSEETQDQNALRRNLGYGTGQTEPGLIALMTSGQETQLVFLSTFEPTWGLDPEPTWGQHFKVSNVGQSYFQGKQFHVLA